MSRELVRAYVDRLPAAPSPDRSLFRLGAGEVGGQFYGARLSSVFQRVVRADGREIGHQGLMRFRSADDATLSPWRLFADTATDDELVQLDRLARTLHALRPSRPRIRGRPDSPACTRATPSCRCGRPCGEEA